MRYEKEDVDEECKQGNQQRRKEQDEKDQKVSRRVRRRVQMSSRSQDEAYQRQECGDWMHDKYRGQRTTCGRGQ